MQRRSRQEQGNTRERKVETRLCVEVGGHRVRELSLGPARDSRVRVPHNDKFSGFTGATRDSNGRSAGYATPSMKETSIVPICFCRCSLLFFVSFCFFSDFFPIFSLPMYLGCRRVCCACRTQYDGTA